MLLVSGTPLFQRAVLCCAAVLHTALPLRCMWMENGEMLVRHHGACLSSTLETCSNGGVTAVSSACASGHSTVQWWQQYCTVVVALCSLAPGSFPAQQLWGASSILPQLLTAALSFHAHQVHAAQGGEYNRPRALFLRVLFRTKL
jgi:hypothetical protein